MFLRGLASRCHLLSRNCFDLSAASELRRLGEELEAKASEIERIGLPAFANGNAVAFAGDSL
jgi:hypothetical protein